MFILDSNETLPLYKQLYQQIREQVLSGRLSADAKLPSVRDMADRLSVSRNTVEGAYQDLYAEGYIYSKARSGYFVSALHQEPAASPLPQSPVIRDPFRELPPSDLLDFHPARLDPGTFPAALWRKCLTDCLRGKAGALCRYGNLQGDLGLRRHIQGYLQHSRAVICRPEQIVVCSGLQNALDMVAQLLKKDHSLVAVENPGYHLPRSVFRNHSYDVVPVPVEKSGRLDLESLRATGATIAYLTPSHQMPMGYVVPVANRLELIEWADAGGNFLIEDDYDSELRYQGKPIPSLQGLRPGGNIMYLGTFSKILSPALRMSYLVLPESLLPGLQSVFGDYFCTVSLLEQLTLAKFMELGHWERHVRRMRTVYKKKHDALLLAVDKHFGPRAEVIGQGAGLHVVLQLPDGTVDEKELLCRAEAKGVRLFPFSATRVTDECMPVRLLLGFGGLTAGEIERGVELLAAVCS